MSVRHGPVLRPARSRSYGSLPARWLALGALLLLTTGCAPEPTNHCLLKPTAATAQQCVETCNQWRQQCQERQRLRETRCTDQRICRSDNEKAGGDTTNCQDVAKNVRCVEPVPCLGADLTLCEQYHTQCVTACNGTAAPRPAAQSWWQRLPFGIGDHRSAAKPAPAATSPTDNPFL